jgi:hypothetical protein
MRDIVAMAHKVALASPMQQSHIAARWQPRGFITVLF